MASVILKDVTKGFQGPKGEGIRALERANLVVNDGQLLALVGPSGCGKTTLLRLIAGLEQPEEGTITMDGLVVNGVPAKEREVAMVFQNPALYPHLSVYDNLAFGLKLRQCPKNEIQRRVSEAAEILGLNACLERRPANLSGGERQRVALGRALVRKPRVFLLDEPLSSLDAQLRLQLRAEIARLQSRLGITMVYVTHDQSEAMMLGHQVAVMNAGAIQQVAGPATLYERPANVFVAGFIGSPPMNLVHGTVTESEQVLWFHERAPDNVPAARRMSVRLDGPVAGPLLPYVGRDLILGVRPENVLWPANAHNPAVGWVQAVTQLVQPLGWETVVYLGTGAHLLAARLPAGQTIQVQQTVQVGFDLSLAQFFDARTGAPVNGQILD